MDQQPPEFDFAPPKVTQIDIATGLIREEKRIKREKAIGNRSIDGVRRRSMTERGFGASMFNIVGIHEDGEKFAEPWVTRMYFGKRINGDRETIERSDYLERRYDIPSSDITHNLLIEKKGEDPANFDRIAIHLPIKGRHVGVSHLVSEKWNHWVSIFAIRGHLSQASINLNSSLRVDLDNPETYKIDRTLGHDEVVPISQFWLPQTTYGGTGIPYEERAGGYSINITYLDGQIQVETSDPKGIRTTLVYPEFFKTSESREEQEDGPTFEQQLYDKLLDVKTNPELAGGQKDVYGADPDADRGWLHADILDSMGIKWQRERRAKTSLDESLAR